MTGSRRVLHPSGVTLRSDWQPLLDRVRLTCETCGRILTDVDLEQAELDRVAAAVDAHLDRYHRAT